MSSLQNNKEVQELIKKGVKQTFLTLEEIQKTMENNNFTPDDFDEIMEQMIEKGIVYMY